jgi:hypothetical protein
MICFVVAIAAEARPLVSHYRLRPVAGDFQMYEGDDVALVVSGIGKAAAAAATSYLHTSVGEPVNGVWFNVGIAGHRDRDVGEAFLAHEIRDEASGKIWHPRIPDAHARTIPVITVDKWEMSFAAAGVYEMEAAGFYPSAIRFSLPQLVQCYKVISDNHSCSPLLLTVQRIDYLIDARINEIARLVEMTADVAGPLRTA